MKIRGNFESYSYGRVCEMDDAADIAYWQTRSDEERFEAAWMLVVQATELQGKDESELRLQRSVATFQRQAS